MLCVVAYVPSEFHVVFSFSFDGVHLYCFGTQINSHAYKRKQHNEESDEKTPSETFKLEMDGLCDGVSEIILFNCMVRVILLRS